MSLGFSRSDHRKCPIEFALYGFLEKEYNFDDLCELRRDTVYCTRYSRSPLNQFHDQCYLFLLRSL